MENILERGEGGDGETTVIIQGEVMGWSQTPAGSEKWNHPVCMSGGRNNRVC